MQAEALNLQRKKVRGSDFEFDRLVVVLQGAVQAGQVKVPPGYHPFDVEKEWGRLHVAILERERLLRIEFERYHHGWATITCPLFLSFSLCVAKANSIF